VTKGGEESGKRTSRGKASRCTGEVSRGGQHGGKGASGAVEVVRGALSHEVEWGIGPAFRRRRARLVQSCQGKAGGPLRPCRCVAGADRSISNLPSWTEIPLVAQIKTTVAGAGSSPISSKQGMPVGSGGGIRPSGPSSGPWPVICEPHASQILQRRVRCHTQRPPFFFDLVMREEQRYLR